jgi:hypothetical protein
LSNKDSVKLYEKVSEKCPAKITGEIEDFRLFIRDILFYPVLQSVNEAKPFSLSA